MYSGGLVFAAYQLALATGEYKLILLEHKHFQEKYGRYPSDQMITPDLLESFGSKYSREINNCVIMVMKHQCEIEK